MSLSSSSWVSHLELLQLEPEVDELHHRVLLPLRVLGQLQDQLLALLDGQLQLLDVGRHERALERESRVAL